MSYILTVINFFKDNLSLILNFIVMICIFILFLANISLQRKLDTCKAENTVIKQELKHIQELQEIKAQYANKTIEKNTIEYKDKIVYIDRIQKDVTKDNCSNAIALLRANF